MSYIGKPAREQHSGRVLLAEYDITSNTSQIEIVAPFADGGSQYRQQQIEFISLHGTSNGYLKFALQRDGHYGTQEGNGVGSTSYRQEVTSSYRHSWLHDTQSGSGSNHYQNATPGWSIGQQNEIDGGGSSPPKDYAVIAQYSVSQNQKTVSGMLTLYNVCFNDDVTRWVSQAYGYKHSGTYYKGVVGQWAFGNTKYTDRQKRLFVTSSANWEKGRIRVWGMAKSGGATLRDGSTPERAGESATELFTNGVSKEGTYWINNMYTGNTPRLTYCKFNMNNTSVGSGTQASPRGGYGTNRNWGGGEGDSMTYHMQKWSPVHMRGYNYNGHYGSGGTCTVSDGSEIESLMTGQGGGVASNHTLYKTSGTSTNSGNKATMRLGITHRQMSTHTWFSHRYVKQHSSLGTAWDMDWALEREHYTSSPSSPPGPTGNFGNNYNGGQQVPLGEHANNATIPAGSNGWNAGTFSHRMTRARFVNDGYTRVGAEAPSSGGGTMGSASVIGAHPTSGSYPNDVWDSVKVWDTLEPGAQGSYWSNTGQSGYGGWNQSYWLGLSIKSRTQNNTEAQAYFEFWVHIP